MTDNELKKWNKDAEDRIIKALECCIISSQGEKPCVECPYSIKNTADDWCYGVLMKDALDLINRLQAENERLERHTKMHDEIKAEAIKEFADRLKDKMFCEDFLLCEPCEMANIIDRLVKEMVGDV